MLEIIIGGLGYGLLLSIMVGPAFFILVETSITKGIKAALFLDLGVLISDLVYVTIAFLFFREVNALMESDNRYILRIIGGTAFILFGIFNLLKTRQKNVLPTNKFPKAETLRATNPVMMVLKGFMINALNPGVLFYWLSLMTLIPEAPENLKIDHVYTQMIYIGIILVTFFSVDVLKISGAKMLKDFLTPSWIRVVNMVLGFILIFCGILFLVQGILALLK
ncbi:LysE family translocator [Crocinitomix algicola]|uniref:LysE family translocator n=1 Tax=Crocinitomix algicola TaxID=1740263 RepID=UPI000831FCD6|nr:LysE family transporter [Crocinitomix algicola]